MSTTTICSWNVNSLKVRQSHVLDYLRDASPDVLGLQELKQTTEAVDCAAFHEAGWQISVYGQKTYNGVALISKAAQEDVVYGFPGDNDPQARAIAATINGIRVINLYVPNGKKVGDEKYEYKLSWLARLQSYVEETLQTYDKVVVIGDFNIAPADLDVHDPKAWEGKILCSEPERDALNKLLSLGFYDGFRHIHPEREQFSWWDYRMGGLRRNLGLRIDLNLCSDTLSCNAADIDMEPRRLERPSDHAPAWVSVTPRA
ncbi:exodeoxyribonuclease III [Suttonella sp. R2A3]|uniref:exodeoxyribonuclease III n=1 Tax=Suttonella sp. R2A3 TaxID=2908648 RepID=UPI001F3BD54F|nr:exodeoxyribonuclease III [Suttonella sp. R2A3]UJF24861.1 exodeoxyribonuclease III [Suttonella sp. R2A3]